MKKILLLIFAILIGFTNAQVKKKISAKPKVEKEWVNPVKLTKEERSRPYMDEVLKTKDSLTPKEAERRRKNIALGNPFAKYGVYPKVATLSKGKYLEFHDTDSIVVIGSVRFNTKRNNIIEVREIDLSDPDAQPIGDTHGRWMSPDPLSEEFPDWSPYNYALNNPLNNIDPTGLAPESAKDDFRLNKDGTLNLIRKTDSDETKGVHTIYNEDNSKSVTVNKDIIDNRLDGLSTVREGDSERKTKSTVYISDDKKSMKSFFNFIKDNVTNEFSLAGYKSVKDGGREIFTVSTEYKKSQEGVGGYLAWKILNNKNMKMTEFTHLHPGGTLVPSGFNGYGLPTEGDRGNKILFENDFYKNRTPNNFKIVVPKSNKTIIYDSYKFEVK